MTPEEQVHAGWLSFITNTVDLLIESGRIDPVFLNRIAHHYRLWNDHERAVTNLARQSVTHGLRLAVASLISVNDGPATSDDGPIHQFLIDRKDQTT